MPDLLFRLGVFALAIRALSFQADTGYEYENTDQNKKWPGWWKRRIIRRRPTHRNTGDHQHNADHFQDDAAPCQPAAKARFLRIT